MIGLATITNNTDGDLVIHEKPTSRFKSADVRVSRTATLDLDVVVDVQGYADGDRTFTIDATLSESDSNKLWDIFKEGTFVKVGTQGGCFKGVINRCQINDGDVSFEILVSERTSE